MEKTIQKILLMCLLTMVIFTVGCSNDAKTKPEKLNVVASIFPVYEFAKNIGGDKINLELLVPPNIEIHDWEPNSSDIKKIQSADIFFYNGGGTEPWLEKIQSSTNNKKELFVETGENLFVKRTTMHQDEKEIEEFDPHIWLDPLLAIKQVEKITAALCRADEINSDFYKQNAQNYIKQLNALHEKYLAVAEKTKGKSFVVMHSAFNYTAKRYNWQQIPLLGLAPHAEPTPAQMAKIIKTVTEKNIKYIFVEPNMDDKIMQQIGEQCGAELLPLDTLENPPLPKNYVVRMSAKDNEINLSEAIRKENYIRRMEVNLDNLQKAFNTQK